MSETRVSINTFSYSSAVFQLTIDSGRLDTSTVDVPDITCQADTLKLFRDKLSELESLLEQYKALLAKDCTDLKSVQTNLIQADSAFIASLPRRQ